MFESRNRYDPRHVAFILFSSTGVTRESAMMRCITISKLLLDNYSAILRLIYVAHRMYTYIHLSSRHHRKSGRPQVLLPMQSIRYPHSMGHTCRSNHIINKTPRPPQQTTQTHQHYTPPCPPETSKSASPSCRPLHYTSRTHKDSTGRYTAVPYTSQTQIAHTSPDTRASPSR